MLSWAKMTIAKPLPLFTSHRPSPSPGGASIWLVKTIFNECAVFNDLEARFARFLAAAPDISRFAALAESYTRFRVDYLSQQGAIRFYYPDFVAVQSGLRGQVNWVIETKGREYENVPHKDASIEGWCTKISAQTGQTWRYLKVPQQRFDAGAVRTFEDLVREVQFL
jgi:type III restriction enzyme